MNLIFSLGAAVVALGFSLAPGAVNAAGPAIALDSFPAEKLKDKAALQNGAKVFMNYCLGCHGISQVRYSGLRDLGLSDDLIKQNLILTNASLGDPIRTTMPLRESKEWFGKTPPDLSLTARSRSGPGWTGADWIYTYMRSYYPDPARTTGWNNAVYPAVGMPHVLWELQGTQTPKFEKVMDHGKEVESFAGFEPISPGALSQADYNSLIGDLTAFLVWAAEPGAADRRQIGVWVLLFLGLFFAFAWRLNAQYWKDIR